MIVNEYNYEILDRVHKMTSTDYEIKWFNAENIEGYIDPEGLLCMIEDLIHEIDYLQEQYEELEADLRENYRPIPYAEQVDISDRDFI